MNNDSQPGDLYNKFQAKKKKQEQKKKKLMPKPTAIKSPKSPTKFAPMYGGKVGGKMSNGAGWGGEKPLHKGKKKKGHKKHKNWISGAIKKPGALHSELGVKKGEKIPAKKLASAAKKGGKEGKRARLAETLKSFHHGKHHKKHKFSKKNDHDADDKKKKTMCKKHKKSMCKMCGK